MYSASTPSERVSIANKPARIIGYMAIVLSVYFESVYLASENVGKTAFSHLNKETALSATAFSNILLYNRE